MDLVDEKAYIFGVLFVLANRIQILGDKVDPDLSIKQWLFIAVMSKFTETVPTLTEISMAMGMSRKWPSYWKTEALSNSARMKEMHEL